jgi:two-component system, sensor histidine kinase and response regulator
MVKVLVVDDEKLIRDYIVESLQFAGFETISACNGEEGLKVALEQIPDAIVSDLMMPKLDGFGLLDALRSDTKTNTIPVIMMTAVSDPQHVREGMTGGAADYLSKTSSPVDLISAVKTQLAKQAVIQAKMDTNLRLLRKNIIYALPHEFRTPLSLIMGYSNLLLSDYENAKADDILVASESIVKASQRLERLIENYLVYAQVELIAHDADEIKALRNHITKDVSTVIASAAREKSEGYGRSPDLKLELQTRALQIADRDLQKIIQEVVDNAFKFSEAGTPVKVRSYVSESGYEIVISDQGSGMTQEQIEQMGAFMQFERTLQEQQGVGLGFSIARRLSELYNGQIQLDSRPGRGTTVTITFSTV